MRVVQYQKAQLCGAHQEDTQPCFSCNHDVNGARNESQIMQAKKEKETLAERIRAFVMFPL